MTKKEFEKLTGGQVSDIHWEAVSTVYRYHPAIDKNHGRDQLASLYMALGIVPIKAMLTAALKAQEYENKIEDLKGSLKKTEAEYQKFKEQILEITKEDF